MDIKDKNNISKNKKLDKSFNNSNNKTTYPYFEKKYYTKHYINQRSKKKFNKSVIPTGSTNLNDEKNNELKNNSNNNIKYIKIINDSNTDFNKQYLRQYVNKKLSKNAINSSKSNKNSFYEIKDYKDKGNIRSCFFYEKCDISEYLDNNSSFNITHFSKQRKKYFPTINYYSYAENNIKRERSFDNKKNKNKDIDTIKNNDVRKGVKNFENANYINHIKKNQDEMICVKKKQVDNTEANQGIINELEHMDNQMKLNNLQNKEIKIKINNNIDLAKKYFLIKEKYYYLLKIKNHLIEQNNHRKINQLIHVNINSELNSKIFLKLKEIKKKEFSILEQIFQNDNQYLEMIKEQAKLEQQKLNYLYLKMIRILIKRFDNISQIYKDNETKLKTFQTLLSKYDIYEKEYNNNINLADKIKELQKNNNCSINNKIKINLLKKEKKHQMIKGIYEYQNVINEEDEEYANTPSGEKSKITFSVISQRQSENKEIFENCKKENNIFSNEKKVKEELIIKERLNDNNNIV